MSEASFSKCLMRYSYIHSVLAPLSKCCPHLEGRLLTRYSPVRHLVFTEINTSFDLHVLSTPPAFVLSQNQTLQTKTSQSKNQAEFNQKNPITNKRHQQTGIKKTTKPHPKREKERGQKQQTKTTKHTIEFSNNRLFFFVTLFWGNLTSLI